MMRLPKMTVPPALRHRRFFLLWAGLLISVTGSQMQLWALFWHIRTLSDQPVAVSGVGLARFFPILIFSLLGGLMADLYNRRKIVFATQSGLTLVALALAILTWLGKTQLWHIYLLTALQAVAMSFDLPARQALVPNLVPREDLRSAYSMMSLANDVGAIVGPALSGLAISLIGQYSTYLFNAVSFLAVLLALVLMGPVPQQVNPQALKNGINWASLGEGFHFIVHSPIILSSMLLDFFATFFSSANTLLPFVAKDVLHVGAVEYGWLSAAQSVGGVTAAVVISQRSDIKRQGSLLLGSVVIFGLATMAFGLSQSFWITFFVLTLVGATDSISTILRNTIRQIHTPDAIRGRITSVSQIFFTGGPQLGEIEAGVVAQAFGTPAAIITGGLGCVLAVVLIAQRWPQLRQYNGDEPAPAGAAAS